MIPIKFDFIEKSYNLGVIYVQISYISRKYFKGTNRLCKDIYLKNIYIFKLCISALENMKIFSGIIVGI